MDISMPEFDGIYGLENIKRIDSQAKIILLTGHYDQIMEQKIKPFNVSKIIEKPCSLTSLENFMKSV